MQSTLALFPCMLTQEAPGCAGSGPRTSVWLDDGIFICLTCSQGRLLAALASQHPTGCFPRT
eukprot:1140216-Pelagomonas_calceolata.AAC.4